MGAPGIFYRLYFGQTGTTLLRRTILQFSGIKPVRQTLVGMVESLGDARRAKMLDRMRDLGRRGI